MLKHMLTTRCGKKCSYCITKNVKTTENWDSGKAAKVYETLWKKHEDIMLTGGEPTLAINFVKRVTIAKVYFKRVCLTTQNKEALVQLYDYSFIDEITFSMHDTDPTTLEVRTQTPVYCAILASQYKPGLEYLLRRHGFSGLTINEEQREGKTFDESAVRHQQEFTVKINKKGHCMDEIIILPDLTIINDFRPYL